MKTFLTMLVAAAATLPVYATQQPLTLTGHPSAASNANTLSPLSAGSPLLKLPSRPTVRKTPKASSGYIYTIIEEDFSGFTGGSQEELSTDYLGVAGEPYIDDSLTQQPGWSTLYGVQADGAIALNSPIGGCLNTPLGDYAGKITIDFRMRIPSGYGTVGVMIANGGIWQPGILEAQAISLDPEEADDTKEWHTYHLEFDNAYSNDDCFVQFCAYYCQILLDDIRICSDLSASIDAPKPKGATGFTRDSFTATWSEVRSADNYFLSVYRELPAGESRELTEDFTSGVPEDWMAEGGISAAADNGHEGTACLLIDDNATLTTPLFDERLRSVDIWFRIVDGASYTSSISVQGFDGVNWNDMGQLFLSSIPTDDEGGRLQISGAMNPKHHDRYYQLRFQFKGFDMDREYGMEPVMAIDNIILKTMPRMERDYAMKDVPVEGGSHQVTGLDPESDYYYYLRVTRADGMEATGSPELAFGISTPGNPSVLTVADDSYTIGWDYTPKATGYHVRDFGIFEAQDVESDYPVLYETFTPAADFGGTFDEPLTGDNKYTWQYLDPYTDNPGWTGASTLVADGCVGTGGGVMMGIRTPELSLANGDRSFTMRVSVYMYGDDGVLVSPTTAKAEYIGLEAAEGWNEVTLNYSEGSEGEQLTFSSQYSTPFMLGEVEVCQTLEKGDKVYSFLDSSYVDGGSNLTHTFNSVDFTAFSKHAFDIRAIYEKEFTDCASELSERVALSGTNGLTHAINLGKALVKAVKGGVYITLGEPAIISFFHIDGRLVKQINVPVGRSFTALTPGLWLVRVGDNTQKVMVN